MKQHVADLLANENVRRQVDGEWDKLTREFEWAESMMPVKFMQRRELSFHPFVKLLGFLCIDLRGVAGDVLEIGVWKGKSLALMQRLSSPRTRVIGIDPCVLEGQIAELNYFRSKLFGGAQIIEDYSERALESVLDVTGRLKLVHIDGGHQSWNVWLDFLIYEHFTLPGGYIVFDDYNDFEYSPEVGPTIDRMESMGMFREYDVIGQVVGFENSYVLRKRT